MTDVRPDAFGMTRCWLRDVAYDLKFHCLAIELDCPDFLLTQVSWCCLATRARLSYEIHANSRDVAFCVGVVGEPQQ